MTEYYENYKTAVLAAAETAVSRSRTLTACSPHAARLA